MSRRTKAIRGGGFASIRQVLAGVMSLVTAILLSRLLGPSDFAIYAICLALTVSLAPVSRMGINAWLMSREKAPEEQHFNIALGGMLVFSLAVALAAAGALPQLEKYSNVPGLLWPGVFTVALLPLEVLSLPAMTRLERDLDYGRVMKISLWGQFFGQSSGVILAYWGLGIWGPLIGWLIRSVYTSIACWLAVQRFPRMQWNVAILAEMLRFGFGYTVSMWLNSSRNLIVLSVIGQWFGKDAVGIIGLAFRVVEFIMPLRAVASRIIVPVLAPVSGTRRLMNVAQQKVSEIEILATIPLAICGLVLYSASVDSLLGESWKDSLIVLPWILASKILVVPHAAAFSVLNVRGHFRITIAITALGLIFAILMIWLLGNAFGLEGTAVASLVFWLPSLMLHWVSRERLGFVWNYYAQLWAWAGVAACLSLRFGPIFIIISLFVFLLTWREVRSVAREVIGALRK